MFQGNMESREENNKLVCLNVVTLYLEPYLSSPFFQNKAKLRVRGFAPTKG